MLLNNTFEPTDFVSPSTNRYGVTAAMLFASKRGCVRYRAGCAPLAGCVGLPRCIVLGACAGVGYVNILVRKADNWRAMEHT